MGHMQVANARCLLDDALNGVGADQWLVILYRDQLERGHMI
jgi:hypothetical protein